MIEIVLDGRSRAVAVERAGADWLVSIDGRRLRVAVAAVDGRWSILLGPVDADGPGGDTADAGVPGRRAWRSHEVTLDGGHEARLVRVDGRPVPLRIVDPRTRAGRRGGARAGDGGPAAVVAPMPGRIVKVLVAPGDVVAARQGVVIVEAMKMENELRAPRAGTVAAVNVTAGMSVDARAVLVVLE